MKNKTKIEWFEETGVALEHIMQTLFVILMIKI